MPNIIFEPSGKSGSVPEKSTVLEAAEQLGVELASECGGFATCSTCRIIVQEGDGNLSEIDFDEENMLEVAELNPPHRLSCQARILGDVTVRIPGDSDPKPAA